MPSSVGASRCAPGRAKIPIHPEDSDTLRVAAQGLWWSKGGDCLTTGGGATGERVLRGLHGFFQLLVV